MSISEGRPAGVFHRMPESDRLLARIHLRDGVIEAAALEALAVAVQDFDADHVQVTRHRHLEVHGIAERHASGFGDRLAAAGLGATGAAPATVDGIDEPSRVGWLAGDDGLVVLGAVTAHARLSAEQARYAAAVGVPVVFTRRREILLGGLTEPVAETVVRVLAPLGFIFDATSEWA
ncbi:hypothetical protein [Gordonia phthalatica]|uniref:hypothetical protein n=1 Tax=Gordonia phthalatica TaxID=1136941 RepID=UPI0007851513